MIQKIKSKKGFTLAELLIVIAIIGVLVAIAIPVFGSQLTKANTAVDDANKRSAQSMATVEYMLAASGSKPTTVYAVM
ncbi:MAG: prepilin-type N-terminal cleavage/methylation domain-containing protein, partial [Oscillospiraceae bacterium]